METNLPLVSLSQFRSDLQSRFFALESSPSLSSAVATPPDIARHRPATALDPLAQLIVDSRGGVTSLAAQEHQHHQHQQREDQRRQTKGGLFSSLRLKAKNRRAALHVI